MATFVSSANHDPSGLEEIRDDDFYPSVSVSEYLESYRTHKAIIPEQLQKLLQDSADHVSVNLKSYREELIQRSQNVDVSPPASIEDDENGDQKTRYYKNAVYYHLAAMVLQNYRDNSATDIAHERADSNTMQADEYLSRHWLNIQRIYGQPSMDVELI